MDQSITIKIESVYGRKLYRPMCETGKKLAELAGHATLTERDLSLIERLGYTINVDIQTGWKG